MVPRRKRPAIADVGVAELRQQVRLLAEASQAAMNARKMEWAELMYEGLCVLAPHDPLGPLGLAEVQITRRGYREAEVQARRAIHAPNCERRTMAYAYFLLAKAYTGQGRNPEAAKALLLVCELDPDGLGAELARVWSDTKHGAGADVCRSACSAHEIRDFIGLRSPGGFR